MTVPYWLLLSLHALGVLCIAAVLFLYEDEEGRIQSKVEDWWIRLSDGRDASRPWATTFMRGVAGLTEQGFDRVFGRRLLSARAVGVSICLSLSSLFLVLIYGVTFIHSPQARQVGASEPWMLFGLFTIFGLIPALFKDRWVYLAWWGLIFCALIGIGRFVIFAYERSPRLVTLGVVYLVLAFAASLAVDVFYIALTRETLRRVAVADLFRGLILWIGASLVAIIIALWLPLKVGVDVLTYAPGPGLAIMLSFMLNSLDLVVASAAVILALLLLAHRPLWWVAQRALYPVARYEVIKKKWPLFALGTALLFLPSHVGLIWIKELLERL